mgnify:CR=1 FL=1
MRIKNFILFLIRVVLQFMYIGIVLKTPSNISNLFLFIIMNCNFLKIFTIKKIEE